MNQKWIEKPVYEKAKQLAEEHWSYTGSISERMYKDGTIHGYGHGYEDGYKAGYEAAKNERT